ncbi:MAG: hypothetical protein MZW92_31840 [Comamonadaceae bacterium]|nr:hypothetical protein [Comamonadaceae bacterium]
MKPVRGRPAIGARFVRTHEHPKRRGLHIELARSSTRPPTTRAPRWW